MVKIKFNLKTIKNKRYAVVDKVMYEIDLPNNIVDGMLIGIKVDKVKTGKYFNIYSKKDLENNDRIVICKKRGE